MKKLLLSAVLCCTPLSAMADDLAARVLADLEREGFHKVEIDLWPERLKIEAQREGRKIEALYDRVTGGLLWQDERSRPTAPTLAASLAPKAEGTVLRLSGKDDRGLRHGYDRWDDDHDDRHDDDDDDDDDRRDD